MGTGISSTSRREEVISRNGEGRPELLAVGVSFSPGETVLTLHGELDLSTKQLFASALARIDESSARIVLDLSDLTFIDCGAIGLIYEARRLAQLRGAHVEVKATPPLQRIFALTGLAIRTTTALVR